MKNKSSELMAQLNIKEVVRQRNTALSAQKVFIDDIEAVSDIFKNRDDLAKLASGGTYVRKDSEFSFMDGFGKTKNARIESFRENLDRSIWEYLIRTIGINEMMDAEEKKNLRNSLLTDVPEITTDNVAATFQNLCANAETMFVRGLANVFAKLDRRFKSHDVFKFKHRIILSNAFDEWGNWNWNSRLEELITDIERVFAKLDNKDPDGNGLITTIRQNRRERQGDITETAYFRIRTFKNGNAHLYFTRKDLMDKVNKIIADFYGNVVPDAYTDANTKGNFSKNTGVPAKDLQFYPTPMPVIEKVLNDMDINFKENSKILEPSAGEGNICEALIAKGVYPENITAIEISSQRCEKLEKTGVKVRCQNFLTANLENDFDYVVMNPPFYGKHYMEHVYCAFNSLKKGGRLYAILPVTAQIGESKEHTAFHKWIKTVDRYTWNDYQRWYELPSGSFKESGTNVQTVVLKMFKS